MWIRSQNKQLLGDYKFIFRRYDDILGESNLDADILGNYKTEERATQVLDEIQKVNQSIEEDRLFNLSPQSTNYRLICFTYQMPEE